ncbi:MAG: hypothetical protein WCT03_19890 [Candidatus Obscuribacterales bacterium]|jgi:hypothetical protein
MADLVENQTPKPEVDRVKSDASNRSIDDAYNGFQSGEGSPENSRILSERSVSDKSTTPIKPSDGVKPEADTTGRSSPKVEPGTTAPVAKDTQARDTVTPANQTADRGVDPGTRAGANTRGVEQPSTSSDGVIPRSQNLVEQPGQRPAEVANQPVAKVPDRPPDKLSASPADLPSDRPHLPGLAIVAGPEGKTQQGVIAPPGTTDGRVHDPAVARPQDLSGKAHDPAIAKAQEALGVRSSDTGLRGGELGTGALTGKVQAGPDHVKADDASRQAAVQSTDAAARHANGASVLKNYSAADGTRSGIDHTNQGMISKGIDSKASDGARVDGKLVEPKPAEGKGDGVRSGQLPLTEGKIGDGKLDGDRGQSRLPDGRLPDGKIAEGKSTGGRAGEAKFGDGKIGDGKIPDGRSIDGKIGDGKTGGGGPSAFIQFIENQAGIRGFGLPAKPEGNKSEGSKADGKSDIKVGSPEGKLVAGDTKSGAGVPGGKSNAIDGFLGLVETVKDNIKGSLKNIGDRTQPAVPLKEGELAAVALRGKMPPLRDDISSVQIIAVLIPKGFVNWSIVRAPGIKPSDSPLPNAQTKLDGGKLVPGKPDASRSPDGKQVESKPFDINNPESKSRPFIQLHGVDSNYTGAGRRVEPAAQTKAEQVRPDQVKPDQVKIDPTKVEPARADQVKLDQPKPIPVKAEPLTDTKVSATAGAMPYIDVSAKNQVVDQSSTRQTMPPDLSERRRLIEEQEHTLPSSSDNDLEISDGKEEAESVPLEVPLVREGEKRLRYVNSALDAQEATWNSEDDDANSGKEIQAPLGRYTYIVRAGDTIESVAVVELNDLALAPLLFKKNKKFVLPEEEYGRHPLVAGVVIDLPTPAEIKAFRQF